MDPDAFITTSLFKWDPPTVLPSVAAPTRPPLLDYTVAPPVPPAAAKELGGLEELFQAYGIRYYTAAKIAELGFTASTLVDMKDDELDDMMNSLSQIFRWDLLVGERYGIKAAVRAERRRVDDEDMKRRNILLSTDTTTNAIDALSQEEPEDVPVEQSDVLKTISLALELGLSEEPVVQQQKEVVGSGGGSTWEAVALEERKKQQRRRRRRRTMTKMTNLHHHEKGGEDEEGEENDEEGNNNSGGGEGCERQREHPFIVTEPGEVARGKKNGLDYLFHLYEQCREFLIQVQAIANDRGEKCPTKMFHFHGTRDESGTLVKGPASLKTGPEFCVRTVT